MHALVTMTRLHNAGMASNPAFCSYIEVYNKPTMYVPIHVYGDMTVFKGKTFQDTDFVFYSFEPPGSMV